MREILLLAIILIWCQGINGKETTKVLDTSRYEIDIIKSHLQKRSIADLWNSIKKTANHVWESVKDLASKTKKRLSDLKEKIRIKAQELRKAFEEHLNQVKHYINKMIENIMKTGEVVKICLQERREEINKILKDILFDVTNCISSNLIYLDKLAAVQYKSIPNQTEYLKIVQNDVEVCFKKYNENDEVEECIQNVRKGIYKTMEVTEENILQNHTNTRDATDDLLNKILECTIDGIIKSTTAIANETVLIIECVSRG